MSKTAAAVFRPAARLNDTLRIRITPLHCSSSIKGCKYAKQLQWFSIQRVTEIPWVAENQIAQKYTAKHGKDKYNVHILNGSVMLLNALNNMHKTLVKEYPSQISQHSRTELRTT